MKRLFSFIILSLGLLLTIPVGAQKPTRVSGVWNMIVETSAGNGNPEFTIKHNTDSTFEGTYRGSLGEVPIKGTLKGNKVYILFSVSNIDIEYEGVINGDTMKGKVTLGTMGDGTFTGTRKKES
jgi:hypothetical protein